MLTYVSRMSANRLVAIAVLYLALASLNVAYAGSLYLPLHMAPEIEARVERLFVMANMPIIKRPIPVKQVQRALDKVGDRSPELSSSVRKYLERYEPRVNITHVGLEGRYSDNVAYGLPNQRGFNSHSDYLVSARGHAVVSDLVSVNIGGVAGDQNQARSAHLDGSYVSLGVDYFQVDLGYRPHWFGPFQDSDMLISTNAGAMPSVTFSNVEPLPFLGMRYEVFWAQMSESDGIQSGNDSSIDLTGNPLLFGLHLSFEPVDGFAIGFNRLMQFGGADRDKGVDSLVEALFFPREADNVGTEGRNFGNQLTSITTRYTFAGDFPFSVYMEYAGEDTSRPSEAHLGNSALMFGIHLPEVLNIFDLSYETAQWQNAWYVNGIYDDGLTHYGSILGHWGGAQRRFGDDIGAKAETAKVIWDIAPGRSLTARYRRIENEPRSSVVYHTGEEFSLEFAQSWRRLVTGVEVLGGHDVFGEDFGMLSAFVRW